MICKLCRQSVWWSEKGQAWFHFAPPGLETIARETGEEGDIMHATGGKPGDGAAVRIVSLDSALDVYV